MRRGCTGKARRMPARRSDSIRGGYEFGSEIWPNTLNYHGMLECSEFARQPSGRQKTVVKRLCRDGDTLLSRPGGGAVLRLAEHRCGGAFIQCAAGFDEGRKRSGFRDVHASKGSNRA